MVGSLTSTSTLDLVCIDHLHLKPSRGGYEYFIVHCDHFAKFAQIDPTETNLVEPKLVSSLRILSPSGTQADYPSIKVVGLRMSSVGLENEGI